MRTKQEYLDLLDETVKYYEEDPNRRAVAKDTNGDTICRYRTEDGRKCAVGRCLETYDASIESWSADKKDFTAVGDFIIKEEYFFEKYKGFNRSFWTELQLLHDGKQYWTNKGLSDYGEKEVSRIRKLIEGEVLC